MSKEVASRPKRQAKDTKPPDSQNPSALSGSAAKEDAGASVEADALVLEVDEAAQGDGREGDVAGEDEGDGVDEGEEGKYSSLLSLSGYRRSRDAYKHSSRLSHPIRSSAQLASVKDAPSSESPTGNLRPSQAAPGSRIPFPVNDSDDEDGDASPESPLTSTLTIHARTFHYAYPLPIDSREQTRLQIMHQFYHFLSNIDPSIPALTSAPLLPGLAKNDFSSAAEIRRKEARKPLRVLDVGSGMGEWVVEMGEAFTHADVVGVDLVGPLGEEGDREGGDEVEDGDERRFTSGAIEQVEGGVKERRVLVPKNVSFEIWDAEREEDWFTPSVFASGSSGNDESSGDDGAINHGIISSGGKVSLEEARGSNTALYRKGYDLIHFRDMNFAFRDWQAIYGRALEHLRPGGWIERVECDLLASRGLRDVKVVKEWWGGVQVALDGSGGGGGKGDSAGEGIKMGLEKAGFVDVRVVERWVGFGFGGDGDGMIGKEKLGAEKWEVKRRMEKSAMKLWQVATLEFIEAISLKPLTEAGRGVEEVVRACGGVREAIGGFVDEKGREEEEEEEERNDGDGLGVLVEVVVGRKRRVG